MCPRHSNSCLRPCLRILGIPLHYSAKKKTSYRTTWSGFSHWGRILPTLGGLVPAFAFYKDLGGF